MDLFSISQLSNFSGVKAHTIRIWEKRYEALKPERSEGNTRFYDNNQLRRLLNIVSLLDLGSYKVSDLSKYSDERLAELIRLTESSKISESSDYYASQLIKSGMAFDEVDFVRLMDKCIKKEGLANTYKKVIYPMLTKLGLMWLSDDLPPAQEHFISHLISRKIMRETDVLPFSNSSSERWLLFLPEDEYHEIGLQYGNYLLRLSGKSVVYLGANTPLESVLHAALKTQADNLLTFLVHMDDPEKTQDYLDTLSTDFHGKKVYVAGNYKMIGQLVERGKLNFLVDADSLEKFLNNPNVENA